MPIEEIIDLLKNIPPSFLGVLAGGGFTLAGVILSNRAQDDRLRKQFDHERKVKNTDREMALRKEIYLDAAEAIGEAANSLSKAGNLNVADDKISERYIEKTAALARIHVIARESTAQAFVGFATAYSAALLRILARRAPIQAKAKYLAWFEESIEQERKERDRWLEHMKQYNLEGISNKQRWDVISGNYDFHAERIAEGSRKKDEENKDLYAKQIELVKDCVKEVQDLTPSMLPVIVAVRQELDLPIDGEKYLNMLQAGQAAQMSAFDNFLEEIRKVTVTG